MKRALFAAAVVGIVLLAGAPAWAQDQENPLPIRRVILYKNGVGYFERIGRIDGEQGATLHFKAKDMSDLLKSLTVFDLTGGDIRTISYDSTKTVDQQLAEYTFDLRSAASLPAILAQLKGSEISMKVAGEAVSGRLLAVERRIETVDDTQRETYRLSVLTGDAMVRHFDLNDIQDLTFTDERLQKDLTAYLATLFSRHRRDEKALTILPGAEGLRNVFVSYVREQPVWKVSYRIVLGEDEKPLLQAWAIVDNVSEDDWENVELSLVSGLPVSFVQNLYDPFYVRRPEVAVQTEGAVGPITYGRGWAPAEEKAAGREMARQKLAYDRAAKMPAASPVAALAEGRRVGGHDVMANMARQAVAAAAQQAGALFVYDIKETVTVKRDRSALLPIANSPIDGDRVAVYNAATRAENPMDGLRLKNTTGLTLEGGPITVIEDDTYAGEALIETLKPDETRYIAFAVDLGTHVDSKTGDTSEKVFKVRLVRGTLITEFMRREQKVYVLRNLDDREKTIIVEHPVRAGWKLVETEKPIEQTASHYRFEVKVPAKETVQFKVSEQQPGQRTYAVTNLNRDTIVFFVKQKYIDEKTRVFIERVAGLQAEIQQLEAQVRQIEQQRGIIFNNQNRLRSNLGALGRSAAEAQLRARYVKKFEEEENRIEAIDKETVQLRETIRQKREELNKLIEDFSFERDV